MWAYYLQCGSDEEETRLMLSVITSRFEFTLENRLSERMSEKIYYCKYIVIVI